MLSQHTAYVGPRFRGVAVAEGAWALIGVAVGAVGGGVAQVALAGLQRRWAGQDAAMAREDRDRDRLFDHKKDSHLAFAKIVHEFDELMERGDPEWDAIRTCVVRMREAVAAETLLASADAASAAGLLSSCCEDLVNFFDTDYFDAEEYADSWRADQAARNGDPGLYAPTLTMENFAPYVEHRVKIMRARSVYDRAARIDLGVDN